MKNISKSCSFTGHRPEKITESEESVIHKLDLAINEAIQNGYDTFYTGMARGVDIWAGEIVFKYKAINKDIKLKAIIPFKAMSNKWGKEWKDKYEKVLSGCDSIEYVYSQENEIYGKERMLLSHKRDELLVKNSSFLIAYYNGKFGGTKYTLDYAEKNGRKVINICDYLPEIKVKTLNTEEK